LTYNTLRRGLFNPKEEDYRYGIMRAKLPPLIFQVFNFTAISVMQNVLLLTLCYPTYVAAVVQPHTPLAMSDLLLGALALVILVLEFTSDNQQYSFQTFKYSFLGLSKEKYDEKKQWPGSRFNWTAEDAKRGFVTKGLWAWSRHPNLACESSFWVSVRLLQDDAVCLTLDMNSGLFR
jgi:steroid 5-alpha reductase family enzyme